jgi:hypothetical protein
VSSDLPEREGGAAVTTLALGMLLLAADQIRAIVEAARRELGLPVEGDGAAGGSGGLKSEAPAQAPGGQAKPSGSPPVDHAPGGSALQSLIGAAVDAQRQAAAAGLAGARLGRGWLRVGGRTALWAWRAPPLDGARARLETETARLARLGAAEEARARQLATATVSAAIHRVTRVVLDQEFDGAYQRAIARLLETPEIAELVRQQSAGMAQELASSVRTRAVSGDDVIERLVGRLLRRQSGAPAGPGPLPQAGGAEA